MRILSGLLIVLGVASLAWSEDPPSVKKNIPITGEANPKFERYDQLLTTFLDKYDYPGAAIGVARDGKILYTRAYGYADLSGKQTVKPDSLFRISSITKPITSVAILQFVEQGKLKLDDPIMTVLGLRPPLRRFDDRWKKITIRHLLEHRGGWDSKKSVDPMFYSPLIVREVGGTHPASPVTIIRYMLQQPLDFDPGTKFAYSNFGYCLLGRVIEKLGKQSYEAHVKKHVLAPLGIKSMRLGRTLYNFRAPGEVKYHCPRKVPAVMGPFFGRSVSIPYGGFCLEAMDSHGGWIANANDVLTFTLAFDDPKTCKILKEETVELMFERPQDEDGKKETYYAKGWSVQQFNNGKARAYWHDGALDGSTAMVARRPDRIAWVYLLNSREKTSDGDPLNVLTRPMHLAANYCFSKK